MAEREARESVLAADSLTVVLGLGSPIMGDDGLGLAALDHLRREWDFEPAVELVDGGTWGMNVLPIIETAERVLLLDAIRTGDRPGTTVVIERWALPRYLGAKLSPHQVDLRDVLALAELRGTLPRDTVAIGLEPERVEMEHGLSAPVRAGMTDLLDRVVERLREWGHRPCPGEVTSDA